MPAGGRFFMVAMTIALCSCAASNAPRAAEPTSAALASPASIEAAYDFLYRQMDQYHAATIVYTEPEYSAYAPSGWMGDRDAIRVDAASTEAARSGRASLKIEYDPAAASREGWAGIYFQYPNANWGAAPGRDLRGATRLTFWAKSDRPTRAEFKSGGTNRYPYRNRALPHADSYDALSTGVVDVTPEWRRFEIGFRGHDLSSVIGPFVWVTSVAHDRGRRTIWLDDITIDLPRLGEPRFIQSYVARPGRWQCSLSAKRIDVTNAAHTYDQAVVLLAFLARGSAEDLRRAELLAQALVAAQANDRTFKTPGSGLRNVYASGELLDKATGRPRLPGCWDAERREYVEDEYAVGRDTGNAAWAALALVQAYTMLPSRSPAYLATGRAIATWIVENHRWSDALGGYSGGFEGNERDAAGNPQEQVKRGYRVTEHNIDLVALFDRLSTAVGPDTAEGRSWSERAAHARTFVRRMVNEKNAHLWTGTVRDAQINTTVIPLDIHPWAVLAVERKAFEPALDWAMRHCGDTTAPEQFHFQCGEHRGTWWEGTAHVAAALAVLGRDDDAERLVRKLSAAQLVGSGPDAGALPAASIDDLDTGFGWRYSRTAHIAATAWYVLAAQKKNPYDLRGR